MTSSKTTRKLTILISFSTIYCNHNSGQSPTGPISFQASQQIKVGDDISLSVNKIKHFLSKIGEKYSLQKKSNTLSNAP